MTSVLFLPCSTDGLNTNSGSIRLRAEWPAKYWEHGRAEVYDGSQRIDGWDVYVFQKAYRAERVRSWIVELRNRDAFLVLDMCDPDWLSDGARKKLLDVLPYFDLATCPTQPLADWLGQYLPTAVVPDGVDLEAITSRHAFDETTSPSVGWIGYKGNIGALSHLHGDIAQIGVDVQVVEIEEPVSFQVFLETLTRFDIILNPRPEVAPYLYKSDNKSTVAWLSGVAVAEKPGDLVWLRDPMARREALKSASLHAVLNRLAYHTANALWSAISRELAERPTRTTQ